MAGATTKSRSELGRRRTALAILLLLGALLGGACRSRRAPAPVPPGPLPPPPAGLLAELVVPSPSGLYASLRTLAGPEARLPELSWLVLAGLGSLPLPVAGALVLDLPLVGAALAGEDGNVSALLACRVRSGAEVLSVLTTGTPPPRKGAPDPKTGLAVLTGGEGPVLGVVDDYLLFGTDEGALRTAGLYVARTLARKPPPLEPLAVEVSAQALHDALPRVVFARWKRSRQELGGLAQQMQAAQGRAPDFGDPAAILETADHNVAELVETLKGTARLRLTLAVDPTVLALSLDLDPTPGSHVEASTRALVPTPLALLGSLPADTTLAVLMRITDSAASAGGADAGAATSDPTENPLLKALGDRIEPEVAGALSGAVSRVLRIGDGTTAFGLTPERSIFLRRPLTDRAAAEQALSDAFGLLERASTKRALAPWLDKARATRLKLSGLDAAAHRFEVPLKAAAGAKAAPPRVDLGWFAGPTDVFVAAASDDVRPGLARLAAPSSETLGSRPELRALLSREEGASTVLLLNGRAPSGPERAIPVLLGWGRRQERVHGTLLFSAGAVAFMGQYLLLQRR